MPFQAKPHHRGTVGTCLGCPFIARGFSYVPGQGPADARLAIIGQAPGEQEAHSGTPFHPSGASGYKLQRWMDFAGLRREDVWVDNVVRCWIKVGKGKGEDIVPPKAIAECWQRHVGPALWSLAQAAEARGEQLRVAWVGTPAMRVGLGPWANAQTTGALVTTELRSLGDATIEEGVGDDEGLETAAGGESGGGEGDDSHLGVPAPV
jgi:hypothetical protein